MAVSQIPQGLENVLASVQETPKKEDPLGRDAFLKMLIAQLKHQDPLNPMEGNDFSAQLAQFSSLEQLFNMNGYLETIANSVDSESKQNILDYIGKEVISESDQIKLREGLLTGGVFTLESPAEMRISIYDQAGREVVTLFPGQLGAGTHQIDWNGYDSTGSIAADGTYRFELTAIDDTGTYSSVKAAAVGLVTGVSYEDGTPYLEIDGKRVDPATVVEIRQPSSGV